jgi:hypothetical protein
MKNYLLIPLSALLAANLTICSNVKAQGGQKWSMGGNAISAGDFLGTTNTQPLIFKANNNQFMTLETNGGLTLKNFSTGTDGVVTHNTSGTLNSLALPGVANMYLDGTGHFSDLYTLSGWKLSGSDLFNTNNGYVGIGTTSPQAMLHVVGDAIVTGTVLTSHVMISEKINTMKMESDSSNMKNATITDYLQIGSGNIPIPPTPGVALEVQGNVVSSGTITGNTLKANNLQIVGPTTVQFDNLCILQKVGIGNCAPSVELDVTDTGRFGNANGWVSVGYNSVNAYIDNGGNGNLLINYYSMKNTVIGKDAANGGDLYVNNNTFLGLTGGSRVGIGTEQPLQNLHIKGETCVGNGCPPSNSSPLSTVIRLDDHVTGDINRDVYWDIAASGATYGFHLCTNAGGSTYKKAFTVSESGNAILYGSDFSLGLDDGRNQGQKLMNRALVHDGWQSGQDNLVINYDGDFEDGVFVGGPKTILTVLSALGHHFPATAKDIS